MSNIKYDKEKVIEVIANYFYENEKESFIHNAFENVYVEIKKYASKNYKDVKMPQFSQIRKIIINYLKEWKLYNKGERLTTAVAYKILETYFEIDTIEDVCYSNNYDVSIYSQSPIICIIKLPSIEILDMIAKGFSNKEKKTKRWGRINLINHLCSRIKNKNPDIILAVIPQFNKMIYLNENGKIRNEIDEFTVICDTLCMFVKNTSKGRKFVEKIKKSSLPQ